MDELERVRDDLAVIRGAAGLELPFGWEDIWLTLALVPAGAFLSAWGAYAPARYLRLGIVPILLALVGFAGLRYRYRRGTGRSPVRRREYTFGLASAVVVGALAWAGITWEKGLGVSTHVAGASAVFFAGVICCVLALSDPARRSGWAAAVVLMAYAWLIPHCTPRQVIIAGGAAAALVALTTAAIQAWQLRFHERRHEPAAD